MINPILKILLIDDEENIKKSLHLSIDWHKLGIQIIGEASSGLEALTLIQDLHPDIVLTDIEMPYINGLELGEYIANHYPDIYVLILTAHEQFHYAKKAIDIGVFDFILKPINPEAITQTLQKLKTQILDERQKLLRLETSYHYIQLNASNIRDKALLDLINGTLKDFSMLKELPISLFLDMPQKNDLQIALLSILFKTGQYSSEQKYTIIQNCLLYLNQNYCANHDIYVFLDHNNQIVILSWDHTLYFPELMERIVLYLKTNLNTTVYCGLSNIVADVKELPSCYQTSKNALQLCYILDEDVIYNHPLIHTISTSFDSHLTGLTVFICSGLKEKAIKSAYLLLHTTLQQNLSDLDSMKYSLINSLMSIGQKLASIDIPMTSLDFLEISYKKILAMALYTDIESYIIRLIGRLCELTSHFNGTKTDNVIFQIINYIDTYYAKDTLSLTYIAQEFYINPSYLSRIFKKSTGKTFVEYLLEIRIQKAIELLKESNYKAYQMCNLVGISEPNYFLKCFKKVVGINFQEYKIQQGIY